MGGESEGGINPVDLGRQGIQSLVAESRMPTEYPSTMALYGGKVVTDTEGRMVFDTRGFRSRIDRKGDAILRTYDEHTVKDPLKLLKRHPGWLKRFLFTPGAKRFRGNTDEVTSNIKRLGLSDYYGPHPWGIEIKKPEVFTKGVPFQDIYRSDLINSERLNSIDRFQALAEVAKYMRVIHDQHGAIGEGVPYRFIFQKQEGNQVLDPVLFIPDIIYNPEKKFGREDQKATDVLELLLSTAIEEFRRSKDLNLVRQAIKVAAESYGDPKVIKVAQSFLKRGRPKLEGVFFSQHNRAHLGFDPKTAPALKQVLIESLE